MSLSSENMLKLMAYADGELEGAELTEAEGLLAREPDAARFVEQLGGLGELVALGHEERSGKAIAAFDVADAVMALAKEAKATGTVTSIGAARDARKAAAAASGQTAKVGVGIAVALALAASVFLFAQHRADETPMATGPAPGLQATPGSPATPASSGGGGGSGGTGVEVSTVNSPGNSVSVFYLPTANELSTSVVVWVDETGEK
jgi:anti-sigma factor RsiW